MQFMYLKIFWGQCGECFNSLHLSAAQFSSHRCWCAVGGFLFSGFETSNNEQGS
jgi:hypothetical protein